MAEQNVAAFWNCYRLTGVRLFGNMPFMVWRVVSTNIHASRMNVSARHYEGVS